MSEDSNKSAENLRERAEALLAKSSGSDQSPEVKELQAIVREFAVRQAELERYQGAILKATADGFCVVDNQGRIVDVNDIYCAMSGYDRNELIGRHIRDVVAMESDWETESRVRRIAEKGKELFEALQRRKDGSIWNVEISAAYMPERGGHFICFCRDVTERKRQESIFRQHSHLLEHTPDAVYVSDAEGRIVYANAAAVRQTGFARTDIVGRWVWEIDAGIDAGDYYSAFARLPESGSVTMRSVHRRKDGPSFPIEVSVSKLLHEGSAMACAIARDMTAHDAREASLQRTQFSVDNAPVSIFWISPEGRIIYANRKAAQCLGYSREELVGMDLAQMSANYSPDTRFSRWASFKENEITEFESLHRRKDGSVFPVHVTSHFLSFMGQEMEVAEVEDITERKKAEEALRESEQRMQSVFRSAPVGIGVVLNRVLQHVNQRVCDISGYSEAELLGRNSRMLYPSDEEYDRVGNEKYEQIRQYGIGTVETQWKRKDGTIIRVLLSSSPIDMEDQQKGVTFSALDITARYLLEQQLRQAQKMESVGRLAGGVAHDFNNMLNVILGHAGLLLEDLPADSPLRADLNEIHAAAERSANLTRQLLAFARKQTVTPRVLDLNETVSGMIKMLNRLIGEDIELIWRPGNDIWPVKVDPSQIDQILANLCVNARDAISDVGRIQIETANCEIREADRALHPGARVGRFVRLAVSDTGCGMDRETLAHIFEPFFTTKSLGKGTGLGLATVDGAVQQNNGFILIDSEPGKGSTFSIYLPRHCEKTTEAGTPVAGAVVPGRETILLVEDEPSILRLTRRVLERLGYVVLTASTPVEALQLGREYDGELHLLMTDVVMPEMNGRDLAKNMLNIYPNLRRLFMSGYTADIIAHHGVLEEGVNFIQKPFTIDALAEKIRQALR